MRAILFTMMIAPGVLLGGADLNASYSLGGLGFSCGGSLTTTGTGTVTSSFTPTGATATDGSPDPISEQLNVGPCDPPSDENFFVSALAEPFYVAIDGNPGVMTSGGGAISGPVLFTDASAEWDGTLEAYSPTGFGFITFYLSWNNAFEEAGGWFSSLDPLPGGFDSGPPPLTCCEFGPYGYNTDYISLPFINGVPIDYQLVVQQSLGNQSNSMTVNLTMYDFSVVDVPEPSAIWLLGFVGVFSIVPAVGRRVKARS